MRAAILAVVALPAAAHVASMSTAPQLVERTLASLLLIIGMSWFVLRLRS